MSDRSSPPPTAALARSRAALAELRSLRCNDPAAGSAMCAVRLAIHTLETWWIPHLEQRQRD